MSTSFEEFLDEARKENRSHLDDLRLFKHTVLGIPSGSSYGFFEGDIGCWCAHPIPPNVGQDLTVIARILRSDIPPPPEILHWIADLFDQNREGDYKVEQLTFRHGHREPKGGDMANWFMVDEVQYLIDLQPKRKERFERFLKRHRAKLATEAEMKKGEITEQIKALRAKFKAKLLSKDQIYERVGNRYDFGVETVSKAYRSYKKAEKDSWRVNAEIQEKNGNK